MTEPHNTRGREAAFELADFHPETGHRHHCENPAACDCAAWLYGLAQQAEEALWNTRAETTAGMTEPSSSARYKPERDKR